MCSLQIIASKKIIDRLLRHCCVVWSEMIEPHSSGNFNFNFSFNLCVYIHLYSQKGFITQYQTKTKLTFNLLCQNLRTRIEKCTPCWRFITCRTIIFGISGQVKLVSLIHYILGDGGLGEGYVKITLIVSRKRGFLAQNGSLAYFYS